MPSAFAAAAYVFAAVAIAASAGSLRATKVPKRPRVSSIPADSSSRYARATVFTAMPSRPASSRTVGSLVPGGSRPPRIPSMIWLLSWSNSGLLACGSPGTHSPKSATCLVSPIAGYFGDVQVTVLSGAGISAESGVPTFRDVETGLWAKVDPYEISSAQGWQAHPERVWAWYLWRHYLMQGVQPNNGHRAVAAWEDHAEVHVVTQNVDNLHERAGSGRVYHLHGSLFEFRCDRCGREYLGELPDMPAPVEAVEPPK